jgi:hypothetical protein
MKKEQNIKHPQKMIAVLREEYWLSNRLIHYFLAGKGKSYSWDKPIIAIAIRTAHPFIRHSYLN